MRNSLTNIQDLGARVTMTGEYNDPVYTYINPSIAYDGKGKLRIVIRSCNFVVTPHGGYGYRDGIYSKSKNLYGYLDPDTLTITGLKELKYSADTPDDIKLISGLEDARLYWRKDGMHFIGARTDRRQAYYYPSQQAEFVLHEPTNTLKYLRTMTGESPARPEKNWLPTDRPGPFEYSYSPTQVYKKGVQGVRYSGFIHGSSQLLWQPKTKTWLAVLHSKHLDPLIVGHKVYDKMIYVHYFAEYNEAGTLIKLSQPFTFGLQDYIQFVAGAVEYKDNLLMSLGAGDARMGFASINKNIINNLLKPYGGTEASPLPPITRAHLRYIQAQEQVLRRSR